MRRFPDSLLNLLDRIIRPGQFEYEHDRVGYWRELILNFFLLTGIVVGVVPTIYTVIGLLGAGWKGAALISLIFFIMIGGLFFLRRRVQFKIKMWSLIVVLFTVSWIHIFINGRDGIGFTLLLVVPLICAVISGKKTGLITFGINLLTIAFLFGWSFYPTVAEARTFIHNSADFRLFLINFGAISFVLTIPFFYLLHRLEDSISMEKESQIQLSLERKKLLKSKLQAEEADQMKTHFLSNMSHEMRTPLNAIIGFTDILMDEEISEEEKRISTDNQGKWEPYGINDIRPH